MQGFADMATDIAGAASHENRWLFSHAKSHRSAPNNPSYQIIAGDGFRLQPLR